ncbi:DUF2568 domain-containing protein [Nocardioides sp.]|uniref:DUF2568 domain-containing protein n=1 Tax=Nocardioides sp. TaxID=35761 RepID=UPI002ECFC2F0
MTGFGWLVLTLVFVDEVLAAVAAGVAGHAAAGLAGAVAAPAAVIAVWWAFASPKAPWGGRLTRPLVKLAVFGAACAGLWWAGHEGWAIALLVFSVVVNALAQLPSVRALVPS